MRRRIIIVLIVALFIAPCISWAQKENKMMQGKMMQDNMTTMADMMMKMSKMLSKGDMKPENQKKCGDMLKQMSQTVRNMSSDHGKKVDEQYKKELQEVKKDLDPLYEFNVHP